MGWMVTQMGMPFLAQCLPANYNLSIRWNARGTSRRVVIRLPPRSGNVSKKHTRENGPTKARAKITKAASLAGAAAFFVLLFSSGCVSRPVSRGAGTPGAPSGPELPEAYETGVRGVNRILIQNAFMGEAEDVEGLFAMEESQDLGPRYINASLLLASVCGNTETVRVLLDNGAEVNSSTVRGGTALMWAAGSSEEPLDTVKALLLAGADVHARAENGRTALMDAAAVGNSRIAEALLAAGAEANATDEEGTTALMMAAVQGHPDCISILLEHGASIEAMDRLGKTALEKAMEANQPEVVDLLIREAEG
jgi:hypothetical protein